MNLPKDPVILLSVVNTYLRDRYPSFTELCRSEMVDPQDILQPLSAIGYEYDALLNQFQ